MSRTPLLKLLRVQPNRSAVVQASELREHGIHHQIIKRAVERGFLTRVDRGLYLATGRPLDLEHRIILACKRVPTELFVSKRHSGFTGFFTRAQT